LPGEFIVSSQKCPRKHQFLRWAMPKLAHPARAESDRKGTQPCAIRAPFPDRRTKN